MDNATVAKVLSEMGDLCEIRGDNAFKVRALRSAAETISALPVDIASLASEPGRLREIKGIGEGIAKKVIEICRTGTCQEHREILQEVPATLLELLRLEGVGPKKVQLLHAQLGVKTIADLEEQARAGKVRCLPRMSEAAEQKILKAIADHKARSGRFLLSWAGPVVREVVRALGKVRGVQRIEAAGSFRRRRETVGDLDFLLSSTEPAAAMDVFARGGEVLVRGETKCSVRLQNGLQADLRVVPEESFGAALHYFTGSKAHNVAVRTMAVRKGLTVNEYGVFEAKADGSPGKLVASRTEEEVYAALGLPWIPAELREDHGEIEAALEGRLPALVALEDMQGDVHMHSTESDGSASIEDMALEAAAAGLRYIAITDHSKALAMANGLDEARLRRQALAIARVNEGLQGKIRVLRGVEVDILRDGTLDLEPDLLRELDVVVASVHSSFGLPREEMTARVVRAIESGCVDVIGHPTGRVLLRREPFQIDVEAVLRAARARGVALELNAYPDRLDLSDVHCRRARELGVKVVISTDSHAPVHLKLLEYGVGNARRGWLEAKDVINTLDSDAFLRRLHEGHR